MRRAPPSACTKRADGTTDGEPAQRRGEVDRTTAGAHHVDSGRGSRPVLGEHEEPAARGEQLGVGVDPPAAGDDADALARSRRRPVVLGRGGLGADQDDVGRGPQGGEHGPVVVVAEPAGHPSTAVDPSRLAIMQSPTHGPPGHGRPGDAVEGPEVGFGTSVGGVDATHGADHDSDGSGGSEGNSH